MPNHFTVANFSGGRVRGQKGQVFDDTINNRGLMAIILTSKYSKLMHKKNNGKILIIQSPTENNTKNIMGQGWSVQICCVWMWSFLLLPFPFLFLFSFVQPVLTQRSWGPNASCPPQLHQTAKATGTRATDHQGEQSNFTEGYKGDTGQSFGHKAPRACFSLAPEALDWFVYSLGLLRCYKFVRAAFLAG